MSSRAFSRRTFGILNETWIESAGGLNLFLCAINLLALFCEFAITLYQAYYDGGKLNKTDINASSSPFVVFYHFLFLIFKLLVGIFLLLAPQFSLENATRVMQCTTVISFIYNYNPWILEKQRSVHQIYISFKYYFLLQSFLVPVLLLTSIFVLWIFWRMSKIEKDYEPCEVIYGGDDSETKILMDDYE